MCYFKKLRQNPQKRKKKKSDDYIPIVSRKFLKIQGTAILETLQKAMFCKFCIETSDY